MTDRFPLRVTMGVTVKDRVREYRKRMKAQGFKVIRVWVPDVNSPEFAKATHEQSLLLAPADRAVRPGVDR